MTRRMLAIPLVVVGLITAAVFLYANYHPSGLRAARVFAWLRSPSSGDSRIIQAGSRWGKATVIVRVPRDPLQPGRQIWVYYTHMADAAGASFISQEFPPGTFERAV